MPSSRSTLHALWSLCSAVLAVGTAQAASPPTVVAGPFEIVVVPAKIGAGGFPNTTANPFRQTTVSRFRVRYRGKPVAVIDGRETVTEFADARVLEGAAQPSLLVIEAGVYLLHEAQGEVKTDVLAPAGSEPARWQWLDSDDGQPGPEKSATLRDASGETLVERGGRLLLVDRQRVLDLPTLRHYPIAVNAYEAVEAMGGYNAGNDAARALSPGRTSYVVVGERYVNGAYDYALVVAEFGSGRVYGVPFDRDALRFESVHDATPKWIGHYFEWTRDAAGVERLRRRDGVAPLPWQGRLVRFGGGMVDYRLYPTQPAMQDALLGFLRQDYRAQDATPRTGIPDGPQAKTIAIDGSVLHVDYRADDRTTSLYADSGTGAPPLGAYALIEKIGTRFNEVLAAGEHQRLFTSFPRGK